MCSAKVLQLRTLVQVLSITILLNSLSILLVIYFVFIIIIFIVYLLILAFVLNFGNQCLDFEVEKWFLHITYIFFVHHFSKSTIRSVGPIWEIYRSYKSNDWFKKMMYKRCTNNVHVTHLFEVVGKLWLSRGYWW